MTCTIADLERLVINITLADHQLLSQFTLVDFNTDNFEQSSLIDSKEYY